MTAIESALKRHTVSCSQGLKVFQLLPTLLISPSSVSLYFPLFGYFLLSSVSFINAHRSQAGAHLSQAGAHLSQAGVHLKGGHQTDDDQDDIQPSSQRMPGKGFQG